MPFWNKQYLVSILIAALLIAGVSIFYFEFYVDVGSRESIEFFTYTSHIEKEENGAFALASIGAPEFVENPLVWAHQRFESTQNVTHRERMRAQFEIMAQRIINHQNGQELPPLPEAQEDFREPENNKHFACWMPGYRSTENMDRNCISKGEFVQLISDNDFFLRRYRKAIQYEAADFNAGPAIDFLTISVNKLFISKIWFNRNSLKSDQLRDVIRNLAFWKNITDKYPQSSLSFMISLLHYRLSLVLFFEVSALYPEILTQFVEEEGEFKIGEINQNLYDRFAKSAYLEVAKELCINKEFEFKSEYCHDISQLFFKVKRTVQLMYENRPIYDQCLKSISKASIEDPYADFKLKLRSWLRPGNYQGRVLVYYIYNSSFDFCKTLKIYQTTNELIGLFKLHSKIMSIRTSKKEIGLYFSENPDELKIEGSNRVYEWDAANEVIRYVEQSEYGNRVYEMHVGI